MTSPKRTKEEVLAGMDEAAQEAIEGFDRIEGKYPEAIAELREWWLANYGPAGHKRLAYVLMKKEL